MGTSRPQERAIVYIDGQQEVDAQVERVSWTYGGRVPDQAEFEVSVSGSRLGWDGLELDNQLKWFNNKKCRIEIENGDTGFFTPIHHGRISGYRIKYGSNGVTVHFKSELSDYVFGFPIARRLEQGVFEEIKANDLDIVFNPKHYGTPVPNKEPGKNIFRDPYRAYQDVITEDDFEWWTLSSAALFVLSYISVQSGVTYNALDIAATLGNDTSILRNHRIRKGMFVPEALDSLLSPYGFGWYIDHLQRDNPILRVFRKHHAEGIPASLRIEHGGFFDFNSTNVYEFDLDWNWTRSTTQISLFTGTLHIEHTWNLIPAWDEEYDTIKPEELTQEAIDATPKKARVWRDFVLDERVEYLHRTLSTGQRLEGKSTDGNVPLWEALLAIGNDEAPILFKRRRFLPNLTRDTDGSPLSNMSGGIYLEIWDWINQKWVDYEELDLPQPQVLRRECGIRFTRPAEYLYKIFATESKWDNIKVRVTATIEFDEYQEFTNGVPNNFAPGRVTVVNKPDGFPHKIIKGQFADDVANGTRDGDVRLPSLGALAFVLEVGDQYSRAEMRGGIVINRLHPPSDISLGTSVAGIYKGDVLQVPFNVNFPGDVTVAYPQVTGITYLPPQQQSRLDVEYKPQGIR